MELKVPSKETTKFAEFIGVLLGDGSIGIYKCKAAKKIKIQHKLQITLNSVDDREYIQYVRELIRDLFGIKAKTTQRTGKTFDIRIFQKDVIKFLINDVGMKLSPKKYRAKIPKIYINPLYELDVLRGYFDTDGSVVLTNNNGILYPRLEMKVCPSPMQKQFVAILKRHGFHFGVYQIGGGAVRIQLNGKKELKKWIEKIGFKNVKHLQKVKKYNSGSRI